MTTIPAGLAALLATIRRPGDFFAAGTAGLLAPLLGVEGIGPVALPLLPAQAEQLAAVAEPAPHGRGAETLIDPAVRRSWQVGPDRVRISGRHWVRTLETIVARAAEGLGVDGPVSAEFYKLLLYEEGGFFLGHHYTEKTPGMFATLVAALLSSFVGGELVVRHKGREVRLDLRGDDPAEVAFAAFYADYVHEVLPVTKGCRLILVYNLVRRGRRRAPEQARVTALLQEPDEEHFREATGNESASFERAYRRAALVLWPSDRVFAILSQVGLRGTLPYLDNLVRRWPSGRWTTF